MTLAILGVLALVAALLVLHEVRAAGDAPLRAEAPPLALILAFALPPLFATVELWTHRAETTRLRIAVRGSVLAAAEPVRRIGLGDAASGLPVRRLEGLAGELLATPDGAGPVAIALDSSSTTGRAVVISAEGVHPSAVVPLGTPVDVGGRSFVIAVGAEPTWGELGRGVRPRQLLVSGPAASWSFPAGPCWPDVFAGARPAIAWRPLVGGPSAGAIWWFAERPRMVGAVVARGSAPTPIASGTRLRIHRLPEVFGQVTELRSFRVHAGRSMVVLELDSPELWSGNEADLRELAADEAAGPRTIRLALGGERLGWSGVQFSSVPLSAATVATLDVGVVGLGDPMTLRTPAGSIAVRPGVPVQVGERDRAVLQVDVLSPPAAVTLTLLLLLAPLKARISYLSRLSSMTAVAVLAVEVLTALRLRLGFQAFAGPPHEEEGLRLALIFASMAPASILALSASGRGRVPAAALTVLSGVWCYAMSATVAERWGFGLLHGVLAIAAIGAPSRRSRTPGRAAMGGWVLGFALLLPLTLRGLLAFLGIREAFGATGGRLAVSVFHVPLGVVLLGLLIQVAVSRTWPAIRVLVAGVGFVLLVWVAPSAVAGDLGLALVHGPAAFAAVAVTAWCLASARWRAAMLLLGFLLTMVVPALLRAAVERFPDAWSDHTAAARVIGWADAERLESLGRTESERVAVMLAVLGRYSSGPIGGRGYMATEMTPHLGATVLREHATSVYVAAQDGLLGLLGLTLVLASSAILGIAAFAAHGAARPRASLAIAGAALLASSVPSIYVVGSLSGLVPFTGRNVVGLGLDSGGDVLEAVVPLAVAAWGLARSRDGDQR